MATHYLKSQATNLDLSRSIPDSQVHGANMGPTLGRQDPGVPHVGHVKLVIWNVHFSEPQIWIFQLFIH